MSAYTNAMRVYDSLVGQAAKSCHDVGLPPRQKTFTQSDIANISGRSRSTITRYCKILVEDDRIKVVGGTGQRGDPLRYGLGHSGINRAAYQASVMAKIRGAKS